MRNWRDFAMIEFITSFTKKRFYQVSIAYVVCGVDNLILKFVREVLVIEESLSYLHKWPIPSLHFVDGHLVLIVKAFDTSPLSPLV